MTATCFFWQSLILDILLFFRENNSANRTSMNICNLSKFWIILLTHQFLLSNKFFAWKSIEWRNFDFGFSSNLSSSSKITLFPFNSWTYFPHKRLAEKINYLPSPSLLKDFHSWYAKIDTLQTISNHGGANSEFRTVGIVCLWSIFEVFTYLCSKSE